MSVFAKLVSASADAEESISRFNAVFGEGADAADRYASKLSDAVGRSKIEIQESMSSFQAMFSGLDFASDVARGLSESLQAMVIDFASFNNLTDADSADRFLSGLSGSSEVFDKYGINIKQVALQQELVALGINKSWASVTEPEKVLARISIIRKSMDKQGATGDASRTRESFANQLKKLTGNLSDASADIGKSLRDAIKPVVTWLADAAKSAGEWAKANGDAIVSIAKVIGVVGLAGAAVFGLGTAFSLAGVAVSGLSFAVGGVGAVIATALSPLGLAVGTLGGLAVATGTVGKLMDWAGERFESFSGTAKEAWSGISTAMSKGDLQLAAQIAMAGVELEWTKMIDSLHGKWQKLLRGIKDVWANAKLEGETFWIKQKKGYSHLYDKVVGNKHDLGKYGAFEQDLIEAKAGRDNSVAGNASEYHQAIKDQSSLLKTLEKRFALLNAAGQKPAPAKPDAPKPDSFIDAVGSIKDVLASIKSEAQVDVEALRQNITSQSSQLLGSFRGSDLTGVAAVNTDVQRTAKATEQTEVLTRETNRLIDSLAILMGRQRGIVLR